MDLPPPPLPLNLTSSPLALMITHMHTHLPLAHCTVATPPIHLKSAASEFWYDIVRDTRHAWLATLPLSEYAIGSVEAEGEESIIVYDNW